MPELTGDESGASSVFVVNTIEYAFDAFSQLLSAGDSHSTLAYTYDGVGNVLTASNSGTTGVPTVILTAAYNSMNSRSQLRATIDSTADFENNYTLDHLQRVTRVEQIGQSGGNTVAKKALDFEYNAAGLLTSLSRSYKPSSTWLEVATTQFSYDNLNRVTEIDHQQDSTSLFTPYAYAYDANSRIADITSQDGTVAYAYDATSQLTDANYSYQTDQEFEYDANGNWEMSGYTIGANNRMTSDGVYNYEYDPEGNLILRTKISDESYTEYTWDHRNRLSNVTNRNSSDEIISTVDYVYDAFDRRIVKAFDADGSGVGTVVETHFVYDFSSTDVLLQFDGNETLLKRDLWAEAVGLVAEENASNNAVVWGLSDHTFTVRDVVNSSGTVQNHIKWDANANVTSETNAAIDYLMGHGLMVRDEETGLHYAWHRYQGNGHWLSADPISFLAGDPNLRRVTGNDPINKIDPTGLDDNGVVWNAIASLFGFPQSNAYLSDPWSQQAAHAVDPVMYAPPTQSGLAGFHFTDASSNPLNGPVTAFLQPALENPNENPVQATAAAVIYGPAAILDGTVFNHVTDGYGQARQTLANEMDNTSDPIEMTALGGGYVLTYPGQAFSYYGLFMAEDVLLGGNGGSLTSCIATSNARNGGLRISEGAADELARAVSNPINGRVPPVSPTMTASESRGIVNLVEQGSLAEQQLINRLADDIIAPASQATQTLTHRNGIFEVLSEQVISGTSRPAHRRAANRGLLQQLEADSQLNRQLSELLCIPDVAAHMRSGRSALRNPLGTEWHHPIDNPAVMILLRRRVHRDSDLQGILHPGNIGGFGTHYGN